MISTSFVIRVLAIPCLLLGSAIAASDVYIADAPGDAIRFQTVVAVTTSAVNQCLAGDSTTRDCWVNYLHVANTTGSAITVKVTDLAGNVYWPTAFSLAANSVTSENFNGGAKFTGGMIIQASATGCTAWIRGARLR